MNPLELILGTVGTIINKIWPDKTEVEKQKFLLELQEQLNQTELAKGQLEVNREEAKNGNLWVSGWRPAVGWVCASAFAWSFLGQPLVSYFVALSGHPIPAFPALDTGSMLTVLMGMLGLGGFRTYEKVKGLTK